MKSYAIVAALLFSTTSVMANEYKFVNADGSALSDMCIAAVQSNDAPSAASEVACNGRPIVEFVRKYRAEFAAAPRTNYIIERANEAPETQLCLAALTSEEEVAKIKAVHFAGIANVEDTINCNGMPLNRFVRKYRGRVASESVNTASL